MSPQLDDLVVSEMQVPVTEAELTRCTIARICAFRYAVIQCEYV